MDAHVGVIGILRVFRYGVKVIIEAHPIAERCGEIGLFCRILFFPQDGVPNGFTVPYGQGLLVEPDGGTVYVCFIVVSDELAAR